MFLDSMLGIASNNLHKIITNLSSSFLNQKKLISWIAFAMGIMHKAFMTLCHKNFEIITYTPVNVVYYESSSGPG